MGSLANPPTWPPFSNIRDCSQGICNSYCSQWCYRAVFPPPPPMMNTATAATFLLTPTESDDSSSISPFVIAIIGILAAAFLMVAYYTVTSRYCSASATPPAEITDPQRESIDTADEVVRDGGGGGGGRGGGVEESLIKSITVCRYKKGEAGVMGITDCSVCLAEFQQDESLRLLPKCCHAFHVRCIDTWLRSNSSCPLCRAHILPLPLPPHMASQAAEARRSSDHTCVTIGDLKQGGPAMVGEGPSTVEKSKNSGSGSSGV